MRDGKIGTQRMLKDNRLGLLSSITSTLMRQLF
jgi:hypothetical protein